MIRASVVIAVPLSNPTASFIQIGDPDSCGFELNLATCGGLFNYIQGVNAQDTASRIAIALNGGCTDPTLVDARTNRRLVATVFDRTITITFDIDEACCGDPVYVYDDHFSTVQWDQTRDTFVVECQSFPPGLDEIDCSQYPPNTHIFRFRFINNGVVFGAGGTDYRYAIDPIGSPGEPPNCQFSIGAFYYLGLSVKSYATENEFYDGWAQTITDVRWLPFYNGSVTHLGNGVMEVVTSIDAWTDRLPAIDLCDGLQLACIYVGSITNIGLDYETIVQGCCIPSPEVPPDSPVIEEPTTIPPPATDVRAYDYDTFICCPGLVPGGVVGCYLTDRDFYSNVCTDADDIIQTIVNSADTWYELCINKYVSELTLEEQRDSNGVRFVHTLNSAVSFVSQENRNAFLHLSQRPLIAILKDGYGQYWFMGETTPVRLREIKGTTGQQTSGGNGYTFKLIDTNRWHLKRVSSVFVEGDELTPGINITGSTVCADQDPEGNVNVFPLRNCYIFDFNGNFLND